MSDRETARANHNSRVSNIMVYFKTPKFLTTLSFLRINAVAQVPVALADIGIMLLRFLYQEFLRGDRKTSESRETDERDRSLLTVMILTSNNYHFSISYLVN
jgi:hypothetical protein